MWRIECPDGNVENVRVYDDNGVEIRGIYRVEMEVDASEKLVSLAIYKHGAQVDIAVDNLRVYNGLVIQDNDDIESEEESWG